MKLLDFQPMLKYFREDFPYSIPFGNSTGAGISIRSGPTIESEVAIFKYIPEQDHFTLTLAYKLVKNESTNTKKTFEFLEKIAEEVEKNCSVKIVYVAPYAKPKT
jgi:hypothetical protein